MMSDYIELASKENMIYTNVRKTILPHQKFGEALKVVLLVLSYFYQVCVC